MLPQEIIRIKRDGGELAEADIREFIDAVATNRVGEGQIAAFTMATFLKGMSRAEAVALTMAMRDSGRVLNWKAFDLGGPVVDKHSTGGVGDVVSLMLGPMLAACGCHVPMISGRGLGHTGGTLDKLDSIPGYQTTITIEKFQTVVRDVGVAIIGQTAELAPADKRIYATRDVTATVESIPLITASILSKKLAAGLDALVMDVKVGSGAFMPTLEKSRELAQSIVDVGNGAGMTTSALLTDMNEPLAPCAGNAIEVRCAIDYLSGRARPARLHEITIALCAQLLVAAGVVREIADAKALCETALASGQAAEKFAQMCAALGGPTDILHNVERHLPLAPYVTAVPSLRDGFVTRMDTRAIGMAVVSLGGGRTRAEDRIDFGVGLGEFVSIGQKLKVGDPLALVYARDAASAMSAVAALQRAIELGENIPAARAMVLA